MRNRHGNEYNYVKYDDNLYRFNMDEEHMKYMRYGGKEGQEGIDSNDLGMFDPPGGPYVAVGSKIHWDEIYEGVKGSIPLTVTRIMDRGAEGLFVEVECEDCYNEMNAENYSKLYDFVRYVANDYFELSHEKVRIQRDDYMRMARELLEELDNECNL